MLLNYFKIAIAVLKRRKFFTFISLFGISFTLTILLVMTAFITKIVGDNYPDRKRSRSLYINNIEERGDQSMQSGRLSFYFLDHYVRSLKTPAKLAISSGFNGTNTYVNNKKIAVNYKYTNAEFWEVLDHDFLEGKPFTAQQIANAEKVVVISEDIKRAYFGNAGAVVGKYFEADNVQYKVCGVVKNVPITLYMLYSDIYLPYTVSKTDYKGTGYQGNYLGVLLLNSSDDIPAMQQEYEAMVKKLPASRKDLNRIYSHADTFIRGYVRTGNEENSGVTIVLAALSIFVLIILALPTLNLVNINITRIMERSSEIGVRKAFGASSSTLVYQFIVENLILTIIGGLVGLLLTAIIIYFINRADLIAYLELTINYKVLGIGLLTCLVFGLLSGVYPAWRMSRMNVVNALKAQ